MDPITAAITIAGIGMKLFGGVSALGAGQAAANYAMQESQVSQQITADQQQENDLRQQAMQAASRRKSIQDIRMAQMNASKNLAAGESQTGGTSSSGVIAGQQSSTSGGAYNLVGEAQNLAIGNSLFGIQRDITGKQINMSWLQGQQANAQGQQATDQGIAAIGGSLAGSAGPLGNILGNWFGNASDPTANSQFGYDSQNNFMNSSGGAIGGV